MTTRTIKEGINHKYKVILLYSLEWSEKMNLDSRDSCSKKLTSNTFLMKKYEVER